MDGLIDRTKRERADCLASMRERGDPIRHARPPHFCPSLALLFLRPFPCVRVCCVAFECHLVFACVRGGTHSPIHRLTQWLPPSLPLSVAKLLGADMTPYVCIYTTQTHTYITCKPHVQTYGNDTYTHMPCNAYHAKPPDRAI